MENLSPSAPPNRVYHYTTQEGLMGIVKDKSIWATDILYMNDGAEFWQAIDIATHQVINLWQQQRNLEKLLGTINEELQNVQLTHPFACSFSVHREQLSQFRGYCSVGDGFSLGFDTSDLLMQARKQGFEFQACIYERENQERKIREILNESVARFKAKLKETSNVDEAVRESANFFHEKFLRVAPLLKNRAFADECEWRLFSDPAVPPGCIKFRKGKSAIIPYCEFILVKKDVHLRIPEVIIGPTPNTSLSEFSVKTLLNSYDVVFESVYPSFITLR